MALGYTSGSFQWLTTDVPGTQYTVTCDFVPKAARCYWVGLQSNSPTAANSQAVSERRGVGFASRGASYAVGTYSLDGAGNAACGSVCSTGCIVVTCDDAGNITGQVSSIFDGLSQSFLFNVGLSAPANITVFYEIWGGDDIANRDDDVTVGVISEPAATGTQSYSAGGFNVPDTSNTRRVVMFAGVQAVGIDTAEAQDSGLHVGFATSSLSSGQVTVCGNSDDGSATMDTDGYNYTGECVSMILIAGGNPNARATLSSFGSGGTPNFQLNWLARATTNRKTIYLAINGGSWTAGSLLINGNTLNATTSVTLSFMPIGMSFIGAMKTQSTVATSTANDRIGFGTAQVDTQARTVFTRNSAGILDENGTANAEIDTSINYAQSLVYPSTTGTLQTAYDISSFNPFGFTTIVDTAGGVANEWVGYLAFGDQRKPVPVSIGHPFIA